MPASSRPTDFVNQQALIVALLNTPARFPHATKSVRLIETHISWVLLAGRYAYKIKKALNLGFLDYTSLEQRRFCCEEEIRLNRRLAPALYLETVSIGGSFAAPQFNVPPAIEYAVRMRRFAVSAQLDRLLARGKVAPLHMDKLAARLAAFHGGLDRAPDESMFGTPEVIRAEAWQNFEQLRELLTAPADLRALETVFERTASAFAACAGLFAQRRAQGFVRECHGDLHLGNIVLLGGEPVPFDGVEFNPALRWIDVMDEVAFLTMDLLHAQNAALAFRFLNAWLEATGDYAGVSVLRFYMVYRAMVRAKVGAICAGQAGAREAAPAACRAYMALAATGFERRRALLITHGLPGSGKSTFAQAALERMQAIRIRSDVERKRLFGLHPLEDSSGIAGGIYGADATRRTYVRLLELARGLLAAGYPVVVDAAFLRLDERASFQLLAREMGVPFAIVSVQADDASLRLRVARRHSEANDASEADLAVLSSLHAARQSLSEQELACAVEFRNGAGDEGFNAGATAWSALEDLLAKTR